MKRVTIAIGLAIFFIVLRPSYGREPDRQKSLDAALVHAVETQNAGAVRRLLIRGANVRAEGRNKFFPGEMPVLDIAALNDDPATLRVLLRSHHRLMTWDVDSALFAAAAHGKTASVHVLLSLGASPNYSWFGSTMLYTVASSPLPTHVQIVRMLLAKGADVDATSEHSYVTPLMGAARAGNATVVRLLLAYGADRTIKDVYDETAEDYARKARRPDIVRLLRYRNRPKRHRKSATAQDDRGMPNLT